MIARRKMREGWTFVDFIRRGTETSAGSGNRSQAFTGCYGNSNAIHLNRFSTGRRTRNSDAVRLDQAA